MIFPSRTVNNLPSETLILASLVPHNKFVGRLVFAHNWVKVEAIRIA